MQQRRILWWVLAGAVAIAAVVGIILVVTNDNGGKVASDVTTTVVPSTTTTSVAPSTSPTTKPTSTSAPPTSGSATTTVACGTVGDTSPKQDGFPDRLSSLYGKDIRTGNDGCFDRIVIELQGTGDFPGWRVQYPDTPLTMGESEEPVVIAGSAVMEIRMGAWMTTMEGQGYDGPTDITPTNVPTIKQLKLIENFEGVMGWAVGLDAKRNFAVSVLADPPRLVVDIQH